MHQTVHATAKGSEYSFTEEVAHTVTHGLGFLLSTAGLVILVVQAQLRGTSLHVASGAIFGASMVVLYLSSTLYHGTPWPQTKSFLQRVDHSAIFFLTAGTFTPFTLASPIGKPNWTVFVLVWIVACVGTAVELIGRGRFKKVTLAMYLGQGWLGVFVIMPLLGGGAPEAAWLLIIGGLLYTGGVVFYAWKRLAFNHALWHLFVLGGSACHYCAVLYYVIPPA